MHVQLCVIKMSMIFNSLIVKQNILIMKVAKDHVCKENLRSNLVNAQTKLSIVTCLVDMILMIHVS